MVLQNRVTPAGDIIADPARGLMMGNRGGAFHTSDKRLLRRRWVSRQWICCRLAFKDRHREVMAPNRYTELFFLDEATALAAGHRPCFECRRQDANEFASLWARVHGRDGRASATEMDDVLHPERVNRGGAKVTFRANLAGLPSGAVIRLDATPCLLLGASLFGWSPSGYTHAVSRPATAEVDVLTPRSMVRVLAAGYCPQIHPSAKELA